VYTNPGEVMGMVVIEPVGMVVIELVGMVVMEPVGKVGIPRRGHRREGR
jgi:hypothetical protein